MPATAIPRPSSAAGGARRMDWRHTFTVTDADLDRFLRSEPVGVEAAEAVVDVVVLAAAGHELHRVPVQLSSRVRGAGRVELRGLGEEGRLSVHAALTRDGRMSLRLSVTDRPAGARETLRLLDLIESLAPPHRVTVVPAGGLTGPTTPLDRRLAPEPPPGLRRVLEDLAMIEEAINDRIIVPDTFTAADRADIDRTAALLRGEQVTASWDKFTWSMAAVEAADLLDGVFADGGEAQLDFETEWQLTIGDRSWPVGVVLAVLESAEIRAMSPADLTELSDDDPVAITLGPRSSVAIRHRLVEVGSAAQQDSDDQRWFWSESWQLRERDVDADVAEGRVTSFASGDEFVAYLDELSAPGQ